MVFFILRPQAIGHKKLKSLFFKTYFEKKKDLGFFIA